MDYIYIGDIVNTHGIKGEVRIISDFKFKKDIFKKGNVIYIGKDKTKEEINSYRYHKIFDMITLTGINDINDVLKYKGKKVFINRSDYCFDGILDEDLINMEVFANNKNIGKVKEIMKSPAHPILVVVNLEKRILIPYVDEFILNINLNDKKIEVNAIEGLIDED